MRGHSGNVQRALLKSLCELESCEAGAWLIIDGSSRTVCHCVHIDWPAVAAVQAPEELALLSGCVNNRPTSLRIEDPLHTNPDTAARFQQRWLAPGGWRGAVRALQLDPDSGLLHLLLLASRERFEAGRGHPDISPLIFHVLQAFKLNLANALGAVPRAQRNPAAICTAGGVILTLSERFEEELGAISPELLAQEDGHERITDLRSRRLRVTEISESLRLVELRLKGPLDALSDRERELAVLVATGATIREAADLLGMAPGTASSHAHRIYRKLKVKGRSGLATLLNHSIDVLAEEMAQR